MDPANSKTSEFERRASLMASRRISANPGGEDDDLDSGSSGLISDGFRPQPQAQTDLLLHPTQATAGEEASSSTDGSSVPSTQPRSSVGKRPSSIAKPPRQHDSLSLRHDGAMGPIDESLPARSSSLSTDRTRIQFDSPYQGPSNPSHPYQLYPQNVRTARTLSVTTSSTRRLSDPPYVGQSRPTHPYGMYPQDTSIEPGAPPAAAADANIPVGFPGIPDSYQRRIGPDGEDIADMIGPDGHTEQLPPYTRYPDEAYARKVHDVEEAADQPGPTSLPPIVPIPGAGGIGLATRNPEFESSDDPDSPRSRHSSRSFTSDSSHHELNTAAATALSEKQKPLKKWQMLARRRLWGIIPYWAICLVVTVFVLMGVILGSVIGTFLSKHKKPPHHDSSPDSDSLPTITVTYDATPIPTPTNLPDLATGTFSMPLMTNRVSSICFNDTTQSQSWNCNILMFSGLSMTVSRNPPAAASDYNISISCNESMTVENFVYSYGEQPPVLANSAMQLVNDTFEPSRGPAWFRMIAYNKTVIVPETVLTATATPTPTSASRRMARGGQGGQGVQGGGGGGEGQGVAGSSMASSGDPGPSKGGFNPFSSAGQGGDFKRKGIAAQQGDKPWICTWPNTFLEIFIYPDQNSSFAQVSQAVSSSTPVATATSGTYSSTPATTTGQATTSVSYTETSASWQATGTFGPIDTDGFVSPPPPYPRVVKLEERRVEGSPSPVCTQVVVQGDGQPAVAALDANGNPIVVTIIENEPVPTSSPSKRYYPDANYLYGRDVDDMSDCGCMWWIT